MGILASILAPRAAQDRGPWSDYWYEPVAPASGTGVRVTPATAMRSPTFFRCVNLVADLVAGLPLQVFRRLADGGRELARDMPLYRTLHSTPNDLQTAREFRKELTLAQIVLGNGYAEILPSADPDRRGQYDLWPLDPTRVRVEVANGRKRFFVRRKGGQEETLLDDEVLHLVGYTHPGGGGYVGVPITDFATEAVALDLAMEAHGASFFGNGTTTGGVLEHPGKLSANAQARLKADWEAKHRGVGNAHRVAVLEEGMKFHQTTDDNESSQWNESRETSELRIARFIGVPPNLLGLHSKDTSWGSGLAETNIRFLQTVISPFLENWEQRVERSLLAPEERDAYLVEHNTRALLRLDDKTRYEAYAHARQWGWYSANDVRRLENENPIPNGDRYLEPVNMVEAGAEPPEPPPEPAPAPPTGQSAHHALLLEDAAARVVRKEIAALGRLAQRCASPDAWSDAVGAFYVEHRGHVATTLHVPASVALRYCLDATQTVVWRGAAVVEEWEQDPSDRIRLVKALIMDGYDAAS